MTKARCALHPVIHMRCTNHCRGSSEARLRTTPTSLCFSSNAMTDSERRSGTRQHLEWRYCGILEVHMVNGPQMLVHFGRPIYSNLFGRQTTLNEFFVSRKRRPLFGFAFPDGSKFEWIRRIAFRARATAVSSRV